MLQRIVILILIFLGLFLWAYNANKRSSGIKQGIQTLEERNGHYVKEGQEITCYFAR